MLVSIQLENFKSFKKNTVFSMQAQSISEFKSSMIRWSRNKTDEINTVPLHLLMGDNNTGKSNLFQGMKCIQEIIQSGWISKDTVKKYLNLNRTMNEPVTLGITFIENELLFEYDIRFTCKDDVHILNECLKVNRAVLFRRNGKEVKLSTNRKAIIHLDEARLSLVEHQAKVSLVIADDELYVTGVFRCTAAYELVNHMLRFVNRHFFVLDELKEKKIAYERDIKNFFKAISFDCNFADLENESKGTKRFINLCNLIFEALDHGYVLAIDELDCGLQNELVMLATSLFHNPEYNRLHAQLIFSSNDPSYLDNQYIRRDEVTFFTKHEDCSELTSLLSYAKREGNYLRKYRTHEYPVLPMRKLNQFLPIE